jgi:bifunctional DNA-binding transcriptional regulator/antitoxin component of YhaV-PrlF toxin-antitoxin module
MNKAYTTVVDEDGVITFPEELMRELGWLEGDEMRWTIFSDEVVGLINVSAEMRKFKTIE